MGYLQSSDDERSRRYISAEDLVAMAESRAAQGRGTLLDAFDAAVVHVERDDTGTSFRTHTHSDGMWVHAYSRPDLHPDYREPAADPDLAADEVDMTWLTGAALRKRVPASVGIKLDPGRRHEYDVRIPIVVIDGDPQ